MPITIQYPIPEEEEKENSTDNTKENASPKKRDMLVTSFANYDFSFSDRLLSEQFPIPERKRSTQASISTIHPQLHSLISGSLDTRHVQERQRENNTKKEA